MPEASLSTITTRRRGCAREWRARRVAPGRGRHAGLPHGDRLMGSSLQLAPALAECWRRRAGRSRSVRPAETARSTRSSRSRRDASLPADPVGAAAHVPGGSGRGRRLMAGELAPALDRRGVSTRPGADVVLARLSDVLFVETLLRYIEAPAAGTDRLARRPARPAGGRRAEAAPPRARARLDRGRARARSALLALGPRRTLTQFLGQPPIQYLTSWRLALAASRLRSGGASLARVAEAVGYESEAAFNRAFKREFEPAAGALAARRRRTARARSPMNEAAAREPCTRTSRHLPPPQPSSTTTPCVTPS